ncbi:Cysteine-rich secretory protein family protein [Mucilaginibacter frigoritolerans]|uniref:Cysteine-rich secretory protein family protein n=1 Tax=Mucilaginibacter frigoritolerans TaxID=652788 RepID=A0A562TNZ8_9SPHI|nr:CAP domain-containing protein [Mucilaginibacter frigoritolerans]TWI95267.1 Cysteine-rich secretory protein family protein [Mucilaginibacter frigoritolerans]
MKKFINLGVLLCFIIYGCKKESNPTEDVHKDMLAAVNALRSTGCTCGTTYMPPVPAVKWNSDLEAAAAAHAKDMFVNNYFNHIAPDGSSPIQRALQAGYTGMYIGENIGTGYNDVQQVMAAWTKSEDHCRAMMDSTYVDLGAARYNTIWVQEFGR